MRIFYDTEFLEGTQDKTFLGISYGKTKFMLEPISIGMVDEDNETYYAIFNDFNLKEAWNRYDLKLEKPENSKQRKFKNYWIRENVLFPIYTKYISGDAKNYFDFSYSTMKYIIKVYGKSKKVIAKEIVKFLDIENNQVELYGYYSSYDHVCLAQCFGKMINLPKEIPMLTYDLKQIMDEKAKREEFLHGYKTGYGLTYIKNHLNYPKQTNEHNALSDAKFNKELHEFLNTLK